jgi:hypothetical protein
MYVGQIVYYLTAFLFLFSCFIYFLGKKIDK